MVLFHATIFQELFNVSKTIGCCVENSKLRVVHKSLILDAVKEGEDSSSEDFSSEDSSSEETYLEEVLGALKEKYKKRENRVKKFAGWVWSKIQCKTEETNEDPIEAEKEDEKEKILTEIKNLEEAHIVFSKKFGEEKRDSPNKVLIKEMEGIKEKITDVKEEIGGEKTTKLPEWDKPNEEGNTPLHLSVASSNRSATFLLLDCGANTNIQDSQGRTALHLACEKNDIDQATMLVANKAKMIPDKQNETPAMENLLNNIQEAAKVKELMLEVYKSKDKVKFFKKMFDEKRVLFQFVEQPEMLASILEREELDPDVEEFINIQEPSERLKTVIHLAVDRRCYDSTSVLLNAGNYQFNMDGAGLLPELEGLLNHDEATKITESIVRGALQKTRIKTLKTQDLHKEYLSREDKDGQTLLSRLNLSLTILSEVVRLPVDKGLKFSIVNNEVPEALLLWFKTESAGKTAKEESAIVRNLLEEKGVVVRGRSEESELMQAIQRWNEKNKQLCE